MKPWMRRNWLILHRWLGLTVGLVLAFLGLTGSALVFDHAIDEWLNPELLLTNGKGERVPLEDVIAASERSMSDNALSVSKPRVADGVWTVWFQSGSEHDPKFTQVMVDPYTAKVTGQRVWGEYFMTWIYKLHYQLFAGTIGATLVGFVGIVCMLSIGTGLYLWWPLFKHSVRAAFSVRANKVAYDLHKSGGVLTAGFLLIISFTGVYMEFPQWFHAAIAPFATISKAPDDLKSHRASMDEAITPDQAIEIAQTRFPEAEFDHLHPPLGDDGFFEVAFRQSDEVQESFGRTQVFLDQYSGEVLMIRTPDSSTAADAFIAWQFPLHNGEAFGLFGRWMVFFLGIAPTLLYVTGIRMWWKKRHKAPKRSRESADQYALPDNSSSSIPLAELVDAREVTTVQ